MGHKPAKVSKLQQRLNKTKAFVDHRIQKPHTTTMLTDLTRDSDSEFRGVYYKPLDIPSIVERRGHYVAKMNARIAFGINHHGAAIIRFCDEGVPDLSYKNAGPVLRIDADLDSFDVMDTEESTALVDKVADFLTTHMPKQLHVHCQYGEQRSVGFVTRLYARMNSNVPFYTFQEKDGHYLYSPYDVASGNTHTYRLAAHALQKAKSWTDQFIARSMTYESLQSDERRYVAYMSKETAVNLKDHGKALVLSVAKEKMTEPMVGAISVGHYKSELNVPVDKFQARATAIAQLITKHAPKGIHVVDSDNDGYVLGVMHGISRLLDPENYSKVHIQCDTNGQVTVTEIEPQSVHDAESNRLGHTARVMAMPYFDNINVAACE